jgi:hypothetical protein
VQYLLVPLLFKTPEFGFAYGISGSMAFKTSHKKDSATRTSVIQTISFLTTRNQNVQALDAVIYFPKENYILIVQSSHNYFPDKFWGLGSKTQDKLFDRYIFEHFYFNPHIKRRLFNRLFVGLIYEFQNIFRISYPKGGTFENSNFYGKQSHRVSGFGTSLSFICSHNSLNTINNLDLTTILKNG